MDWVLDDIKELLIMIDVIIYHGYLRKNTFLILFKIYIVIFRDEMTGYIKI